MTFMYFRILTKPQLVAETAFILCLLPSFTVPWPLAPREKFYTVLSPHRTPSNTTSWWLIPPGMVNGFLCHINSEVLSGIEPIYELKTSYNKPTRFRHGKRSRLFYWTRKRRWNSLHLSFFGLPMICLPYMEPSAGKHTRVDQLFSLSSE